MPSFNKKTLKILSSILVVIVIYCVSLSYAKERIEDTAMEYTVGGYEKVESVKRQNQEILQKQEEIIQNNVKKEKYRWLRETKSDLEYFNNYIVKLNAYDASEWFIEYHTPIFVIGIPPIDDAYYWRERYGMNNKDGDLVINPILKDYQFAQVFGWFDPTLFEMLKKKVITKQKML